MKPYTTRIEPMVKSSFEPHPRHCGSDSDSLKVLLFAQGCEDQPVNGRSGGRARYFPSLNGRLIISRKRGISEDKNPHVLERRYLFAFIPLPSFPVRILL